MALLLSMQSGDRITVADILFTVLSSPPRLVSAETTIPLSEADTVLPHGVTVALATPYTNANTAASALTLRCTAPKDVLIKRTRGEAA
ncbi:MAG: hypothetical protein KGJ73_07535 [Rhodospirillales bacterium]|nr:hypothetical protein [Rhodospirillales bacterium]